MAQSKRKLLKISKGQIAPTLIERSDIGILDSSGQEIVNFKNSKYGTLKSIAGSIIKHYFNNNSLPFGYKIVLPNRKDGVLIADGYNHTMTLFSANGEQLSDTTSVPSINEDNYKVLKFAQTSNLLLFASGNNPIMQVNISSEASGYLYGISVSVFAINQENVVKSASVKLPTVNPLIFRFNTGNLPTDPSASGLEIGDFAYLNTDSAPSSTFPWTVNRLDSFPTADTAAQWTQIQYTPDINDTLRDVWSGNNWVLGANNNWVSINVNSADEQYNVPWFNLSTSGYNTIYGQSDNDLFTKTAPDGYDAEKYVRALIIGTKFDGLSTGGVIQIQDIAVEIDENNPQTVHIKKIHGTTLSDFDKAYSSTNPATGFRITYSMVPTFAVDYPGTQNNITNSTNYPLCILFYQQRLIIAGTKYNGLQLVFSETGLYDSFIDTGYVDGGFQLVIGSNEEEVIQNIIVNQVLQIFTDKAEWLLPDTSITQASGFTRNSTIGSKGSVQPIIGSNGTTLFVPNSGKGVCALMYNNVTANYNTPRISLFTNLLDVPIDNIGYKHAQDSTDDNYLYCANIDGDVIIGNYIQEHQVQAFTRWNIDGKIRQVICNNDDILAIVERNGHLALEYMTEQRYTQGGIDVEYNANTGVITLPNNNYNGKILNVFDQNHKFFGSYKIINNRTTLSGNLPSAITEIGYNINSVFESNPLNIGASTETINKSVVQAQMLFSNESILDYVKLNNKKGWTQDKLLRVVRPVPPRKKAQIVLTNDVYPIELLSCEMLIDY